MNRSILLSLALFSCIPFSLSAQQITCTSPDPINTDLIGCYQFDGNADDNINASNNGLASDAIVSSNRFNQFGTCYTTIGNSSSKITIPIENFRLNSFSYSIWVKFDSLPSSGEAMSIICNGTPATANQSIIIINAGGSYTWTGISYYNNVSADNVMYHAATVDTSTWYHVVFTRDSAAGTANLFINNVLATTDSSLTEPIAAYGSQGEFIVGTRGTTQFFEGRLDDLRIYSRALSNSEVTQLYSLSTGIKQTKQTISTINLYPTPAQEHILIDNPEQLQNLSLSITNILGQSVFNRLLNNDLSSISTDELGGNGTYIAQIKDPSGHIIHTQRLIILNK